MPIPDTGELDAPISPAMYPHTAAIISPATRTNTNAPAISSSAEAASAPPAITFHSNHAIGNNVSSDPPATQAIGMSRSSSGSVSPLPRAALATRAERTPPMTGPAILTKVQIAETPINPAPKKRTSLRQMKSTHLAMSPGIGWYPVITGTRTNQPITTPSPIAAPTEMPTRCPTPSKANDRLPDMPVAPAPTRKVVAAVSVMILVWVKIANTAEATLFQISTSRPCRASASPSREPAPICKTSAAATPSG